jgi:hypothetical protein
VFSPVPGRASPPELDAAVGFSCSERLEPCRLPGVGSWLAGGALATPLSTICGLAGAAVRVFIHVNCSTNALSSGVVVVMTLELASASA